MFHVEDEGRRQVEVLRVEKRYGNKEERKVLAMFMNFVVAAMEKINARRTSFVNEASHGEEKLLNVDGNDTFVSRSGRERRKLQGIFHQSQQNV